MARAGAVVKDLNLGWDEIQQQLALIDKSYVLVGFQEGSVTKRQQKGERFKKAALSMPEIAAANEFGTQTIPARPFMSTAFDENIQRINRAISTEYTRIVDGKTTVQKSLGLIGLLMTRFIVKKIEAIQFPPNSPRTIAIKKSSKPLIDFGQMVQSVTQKVVIQ